MRLVDGIKLIGRPAEIPDCTRDELPSFLVEMGFRVGAEIGVSTGIYSEILCRAGLKVYSIDPWTEYEDYYRVNIQDTLDQQYEEAKKRLTPYDCTIIRKASMEALGDFKDGSLDFVYIDGHHGFKYIAEDLCGWTKKVRAGGIIAGHDYFINRVSPNNSYRNHVKYVVDAYTLAFGIKNWFLL